MYMLTAQRNTAALLRALVDAVYRLLALRAFGQRQLYAAYLHGGLFQTVHRRRGLLRVRSRRNLLLAVRRRRGLCGIRSRGSLLSTARVRFGIHRNLRRGIASAVVDMDALRHKALLRVLMGAR